MKKHLEKLFEPVPIASLVTFRVLFGVIMAWEAFRYAESGWLKTYWIDPEWHFKYYGFEWVQPLPGIGMYLLFAVIGVSALGVLLGYRYRLSATVLFLTFTYQFLLDQSTFLNHFYFVILLAFIMIFVPANRALSLDADRNPEIRSNTTPAWAVWLLRFQIACVYFWGGMAKIVTSDWLKGEPLTAWLAQKTELALAPVLTWEYTGLIMSWAGCLLDLFITPVLLFRKTRWFGMAALLIFHSTNGYMFNIGIFPWIAFLGSFIFFPPDWKPFVWFAKTPSAADMADEAADSDEEPEETGPFEWTGARKLTLGLLAVFAAVQIFMPLRHWLYPGNVHWTEEGHRFAWHMKLRTKNVRSAYFATIVDTGETIRVDPSDYLTQRQWRKMQGRPDMILQFAHYVGETLEAKTGSKVEVRGVVAAALNTREPALLIDRQRDLMTVERHLGHNDWITEFKDTPLNELEPWIDDLGKDY